MQTPKVSVIIPIYKVEKYLVQCLESVVNQTLKELEIILLDEGEQDRCREIIDFYEQADPRVVTIHEPNPDCSYGAKINRGLDRATGEFIGIVEPDDFIDLDMYEQLYDCAKRTGANIVKASYYDYFDEERHSVSKSFEYISTNVPHEKVFEIDQFPHLIAMHPSMWSAIYRREALEEKGVRAVEAPGAGYVDTPFYIDTYVKLGKIAWLDRAVYHWRQSSETSSSASVNWKHGVQLARWNENLDNYPADDERYKRLWPYFANKAQVSVFRHYLRYWTFDEKEYADLVAFLNRFSEDHLRAAPRLTPEQIRKMIRCRNNPEGFKKELLAKDGGLTKLERICRKLAKPVFCAAAAGGTVFFMLFAVALKIGVLSILIGDLASDVLALLCALLSLGCMAGLGCCVAAWIVNKKRQRREKGRQLYICSTFYHVYVTLLKQLAEPKDTDVVVFSDIPDGSALTNRLQKTGLFRNVWYIRRKDMPKYSGKGWLDELLFQHLRDGLKFRMSVPFKLVDYADVYIYHDEPPLGRYLNDVKRPYHLIEDGLNFYQFILQTPQARFLKPDTFGNRVKKALNMGHFPLGGSRYMIDLEVNENKNLQVHPKHVVEVPRAPLQERLTEQEKKLLLQVFNAPKLDMDCSNTALVLTEPLFQDKVCASKEEQLDIYREMISALKAKGYKVMIKPHPRDKVDYSELGEEMFKKEFPLEVMQFFPELRFAAAATVKSTAVNAVSAEKKYWWESGLLRE